jgi:hypothetical protein
VVALALAGPHSRAAPWLGLALVVATLLGGFWRQSYVRAAVPGLLACLLPLLAPTLAMRLGEGAGLADCTTLCFATCLLAGIAAGGILVRRSRSLTHGRRAFLLTAGAIGTLAASMTCLQFGLLSLALLTLGYAVTLVPGCISTRIPEGTA